ncbi:HupE/UreJ family protein [Cyanobium sp. FACHB-13342]|uniref:HupE/UreJ family protein n=1 Tax=Cyanobium sp. FACHB-13342 TaxID=2692793 RepID=UPI001681455E|nr:HupE/UreJ family protein [Cyanobium sp. FACHB-13342]MBD2423195.1 HupE/UreJ family protein [Cyanobium sp. FACHB-13342]
MPGPVVAGTALVAPLLLGSPALAHHVADLGQLAPTAFNGVLSGLAHPVLGPDHLLFLLALSLVGLQHRRRWSLGLLVVGLLGSAAGLLWPGLPGAEVLVACTLVVEALVLLRRLPLGLLLPAMALHGYVLSGPVFGWTSMPVAAYAAGLLISQGGLLILALVLLRPLAARLSPAKLRWMALALAGCGATWAVAAVAG